MTAITHPRLVAVLGATGTVGTEVMRILAQQSCAVRGILRRAPQQYPVTRQERPARVSYVVADPASDTQMARSLAGADALFLLVGTHPGQVQAETRVIAAAQRAGVRRIIKMSAPLIPAHASVEVASWHRAVEGVLAASDLEHASLRPYAFMQNWLRNTAPIRQLGVIIGAAGDAPRNYVDARDVAAVAANLLLQEDAPATPYLTLTGPEAIPNAEMAARITQVTGTPVRYDNLSSAAYEEILLQRGRLPAWLARHVVELEELAVQDPEPQTDSVGALLGRSARTMDEFLLEHRDAFMRQTPLASLRALVGLRAGAVGRAPSIA